MAKCQITGKRALSGNRVSHANNKTKHRQQASVRSKRVWDDEAGKWVRIKISSRGLKTLNRKSVSALRKRGLDL